MYILKTKGTAKIPDYIQFRDDNFTLCDYIKANTIEKHIERFFSNNACDLVLKKISEADYGVQLEIKTNEKHIN